MRLLSAKCVSKVDMKSYLYYHCTTFTSRRNNRLINFGPYFPILSRCDLDIFYKQNFHCRTSCIFKRTYRSGERGYMGSRWEVFSQSGAYCSIRISTHFNCKLRPVKFFIFVLLTEYICEIFIICTFITFLQSDDKSVRIWRTLDWQQEECITGPFKEVRCYAYCDI